MTSVDYTFGSEGSLVVQVERDCQEVQRLGQPIDLPLFGSFIFVRA